MNRIFCLTFSLIFTTVVSTDVVLADIPKHLFIELCEDEQILIDLSDSILENCLIEFNNCKDTQKSLLGLTEEEADNLCKKQKLKLDSNYTGMCPEYLIQMESRSNENTTQILELVTLRNYFTKPFKQELVVETFRRTNSERMLKDLLSQHPDSSTILEYLAHVERLKLESNKLTLLEYDLARYEADPDCPQRFWYTRNSTGPTLDYIIDSFIKGSGAGSELNKAEITALVQRTRNAILGTYHTLLLLDTDLNSLYASLESIHNSVLLGDFSSPGDGSDITLFRDEGFQEQRKQYLTDWYSSKFGIDADPDTSEKLRWMCNDYAFEIGLKDHCLKLIEYYGQQDDVPNTDLTATWSLAATLLINALTRDCKPNDGWWIGLHEYYWNYRECHTDKNVEYIEKIRKVVATYDNRRFGASQQLLFAYLHLNKSSVDHFRRAIAHDEKLAYFAPRLAKRLHRLGLREDAENIMKTVTKRQFENFEELELDLYEYTLESISDDSYANWFEYPILDPIDHDH